MTAPAAPRTARREDRRDNSDRDTARGMVTATTT